MQVKEGEKVIIEQRNRPQANFFEDIVTSVGNKYFYVEHYDKRYTRFLKDSGMCETFEGYGWARNSNYRAFQTLDEYKYFKSLERLIFTITSGNVSSLKPAQIVAIAKEYNKEKQDERVGNDIERVEQYLSEH